MTSSQFTTLTAFLVLSITFGVVVIATLTYVVTKRWRKKSGAQMKTSSVEKFIKRLLGKLLRGENEDSVTKVLTPATNRTITITNRSRDSVASIISNFTEVSSSFSVHNPQPALSAQLSPIRKQMSLQLPSISVTSTSPTDAYKSFLTPRRQSHQLTSSSCQQAFLLPNQPSSRRSSIASLQEETGACLGGIDPSLYKRRYSAGSSVSSREDLNDDDDDSDDLSPDYLGRVRFSLDYCQKGEKLTVVVHQARHLALKNSHLPDSCDPFFKLVLLPDLRSQVKTTHKKRTCNPKFEESFIFQVPAKDLNERTLKLTAYDVDKLRRHNVIGHVTYSLRDLLPPGDEKMKKITVIRDLETEECTDDKGEMLVSFVYNNVTERLSVGIFEARKVQKPVATASSDYYLKVALMKNNSVVKKKKSDVVRNELDPKFNISFTFKQIPESLLGSSCVVLSLMQYLAGHKDKMVGRVVVGSFMHARGRELEHWDDVINKPKETITCWHSLT